MYLNPCSKHFRQQTTLQSRQALLAAVMCNAKDIALWPICMHHLIRFACCASLVILSLQTLQCACIRAESKQPRQQLAVQSRQALHIAVISCEASVEWDSGARAWRFCSNVYTRNETTPMLDSNDHKVTMRVDNVLDRIRSRTASAVQLRA